MELPAIYSKNKKVKGNTSFNKASPRRDLFKLPTHLPVYNPSLLYTQNISKKS